MASAANWNLARESRAVLKRFRRAPPSLSVELYPRHFRFKEQNGIFLYESPMKVFLEAVRSQEIPADLMGAFASASVPYYDGCLIVELVDHRPRASASSSDHAPTASSRASSQSTRIVLHPTASTVWRDIADINDEVGRGTWDDYDALELESRILASIGPPLYLGTSVVGSRIANTALAISTPSPVVPNMEGSRPGRTPPRARAMPEVEGEEWKTSFYKIGKRDREPGGFQPNFDQISTVQAWRERGQRSLMKDASLPPQPQEPLKFTSAFAPEYVPLPTFGSSSAPVPPKPVGVAARAAPASVAGTPGSSHGPSGPLKDEKKSSKKKRKAEDGGDDPSPALGGLDASATSVEPAKKVKKVKARLESAGPSTPGAAPFLSADDLETAVKKKKSSSGKSGGGGKASSTPAVPSIASSSTSLAAGTPAMEATLPLPDGVAHPQKKKQRLNAPGSLNLQGLIPSPVQSSIPLKQPKTQHAPSAVPRAGSGQQQPHQVGGGAAPGTSGYLPNYLNNLNAQISSLPHAQQLEAIRIFQAQAGGNGGGVAPGSKRPPPPGVQQQRSLHPPASFPGGNGQQQQQQQQQGQQGQGGFGGFQAWQ